MSITLSFLGTPEVKAGTYPVTTQLRSKEIVLLAYLVVGRTKFTRDRLAGLLWGEQPESNARQNLRQAISNINKVLPGLLELEGRRYVTLNQRAVAVVDIWDLEKAYKQRAYERVIDLHQGEFLEGLMLSDAPDVDQWHTVQAGRFQEMVIGALEALLRQADEQREPGSVLEYARRTIALRPWHEEAQRHMMLALARQGDFNAALSVYEKCRQTLKEEFGIAPAPDTIAAYERIQLARVTRRPALPFHPTTFVGRERELAEIAEVLAQPNCRLLTLLGIGGIGKTRLAIELARRQRHRFLHDTCFVALAAQPLGGESALFLALGRELNLPFTTGDVRAQLLDYLRHRELLLILDNFEHLVARAPALSNVLREAPAVTVLVTSRERLDVPEEWVVEVGGMAVPAVQREVNHAFPQEIDAGQYDALVLFNHCVRRLKADFSLEDNLAEVIRICQLVEGLPLGLELVAPWTLTMSCADIGAKIAAERHALLQTSRNFPQRHRNLQALFEYSWQRLAPEEKEVFRRLAVFPGSFSLAAAARVAGATGPILATLARKKSMLVTSNGSYDLHALLRAFAHEKLLASGELHLSHQRHCDFYRQFLETKLPGLKGPGQKAALNELEREFDNLRAAWWWGIENAPGHTLSTLMEGLFQLCNVRNWYVAGIELFQLASEPLARRGMTTLQGRLLLHQGLFHQRLGQYDLAIRCGESGLALCERQGDRPGVARAQYVLGCTYFDMSHYDVAQRLQESSLAIYREIEDEEGTAGCLHQLGLIFGLKVSFSSAGKKLRYRPPGPYIVEHYDPSTAIKQAALKARACFQESLQLYRRAGHSLGEALALHCIGFTWYMVKEYGTAAIFLEEAVSLLRQLNATSDLTQSLNWLAWTLQWHDKKAEAKRHFLEALGIGLESLAYKRLLDCLNKFALFLYVTEKDTFTALAISAFVAQHPNTDARIRAVAEEWILNICEYMSREEAERAIAYGKQQSLANLVYTVLSNHREQPESANLLPFYVQPTG